MHNYVKPLQLGSLRLPTNLIQGPLAGYTCAPMRVQTWRFSNPAYCSTEMVSATHLVHAKEQPKRYTYRHPEEGPLCFQLSASEPETLSKAVKIVDGFGAEIIELNCGCPVQKIRAKGAGSKLLAKPEQLKNLLAAMRDNTNSVLSLKIRVAGDQDDQDNVVIAELAEQMGVDVLIVHGRHWSERYDVECRYDQIKNIVNAVKIPVIGNGDVCDPVSLKKMFATGCAGVMIARACMGQPWLFSQLTNDDFIAPTAKEVGAVFIDHIEQLAELDTPFRAVLQARKIGKYYAADKLNNKNIFLDRLMQCHELQELKKITRQLFG